MKLKAFTLLELLIGMIISGIVISFGYSAWSMLSKEFGKYRKMKSELLEHTLFQSAFENDLFRAERIVSENGNIKMDGVNAVLYTLDTIVLRKTSTSTDTFHVSTRGVVSLPIAEGFSLIETVNLTTTIAGINYFNHYSKEYDAETLIKEKGTSNE